MYVNCLACSKCGFRVGLSTWVEQFKKADGTWVNLSHPSEFFQVCHYLESEGVNPRDLNKEQYKERQRKAAPILCMGCGTVNYLPMDEELNMVTNGYKCACGESKYIESRSVFGVSECPKCKNMSLANDGIFTI